MAKKIFVSYNYKDSEITRTINSMVRDCGGIIDGVFVFVENDMSNLGERAIESEIRKVMNQCDAALFVVGDDCHNSPWINREAQLAKSLGLNIVITRIPYSDGGIPYELMGNRYAFSTWSSRDLAFHFN
ncbi:TIR domain-containing protein [Shewanella insulae]|uniref:TIR domain-containing protein n=1 Tax=Shewanella insulae TaxID=2681496 RepID=UPI001EFE4164|nr:TIR domain-containing protein [Shewanella insulae]MCG9738379.1 TIR domain-containing protein [Shewanella insulae]